jgi:hypothetical protein
MPVAIFVASVFILATTMFNQWAFWKYSSKPAWDWRRKGPVLIATSLCILVCWPIFQFGAHLTGDSLAGAVTVSFVGPMMGSILIVVVRSIRARNRALRAIEELKNYKY